MNDMAVVIKSRMKCQLRHLDFLLPSAFDMCECIVGRNSTEQQEQYIPHLLANISHHYRKSEVEIKAGEVGGQHQY